MHLKSLIALSLLGVAQCFAQSAPYIYSQPPIAILGPGSTTMFYWDPLGIACGVGLKSSGTVTMVTPWNSSTAYTTGQWVTSTGDSTYPNRSYWAALANNTDSPPTGSAGTSTNANWQESPTPLAGYVLVQNPAGIGVPAYYSMGDSPCPDYSDRTVTTTAQWQTKWGSTNAGMVSWLNSNFDGGFANTANIFYLSLSGNNSTAVVNDPTHPYATISCIMVATGTGCNSTTQPQIDTNVSNFTGYVETTSGQNVITVSCSPSCTGTLVRGSVVTKSGTFPVPDYVVEQINGTAGTSGQYLTTANALATNASPVAITGGYQPGGVIVIRAGQWPGCASSTPASPCLSFSPGEGGNISWELSGSEGHPLLITNYPGEVVNLTSVGQGGGNVFEMNATYSPKTAACCLIVNGLQFQSATYGQGDLGVFVSFTDSIFERNEWAGWDNFQTANGTHNFVLRWNVGHDIYAHFRYDDWDTGCALSNPGVDTNFAQDALNVIAGTSCGANVNNVTQQNIVYDSCYEGYDCIHINGYGTGHQVIGNIVSYSGYPVSVDTGQYGVTINGNLFFDDASECVLFFTYTNYYGVATFGANSTGLTISAVPPVGGANSNWPGTSTTMYVYGPGLPAGPPPSGATIPATGSGAVVGSYTMSAASLAAGTGVPVSMGGNNGASNNPGPSTLRWGLIENNVCEQGNPSDQIYGGNPGYGIRWYEETGTTYMKNIAVLNNTIATYNSDSGVGQMPLSFLVGSAQSGGSYTQPTTAGDFPETDTITANTFFNSDTGHCSSNCNIMNLDAGASQTIAGGTYTFSGSGQFSSYFSGNTYASSTPFPNCPESYAQTPWLCTFPASLWH